MKGDDRCAVVDEQWRITLPDRVLEALGAKPGETITWELTRFGATLRKKDEPTPKG
ncbi:MAG: hypothetical protein ACFE0P_09210 [Oceanicaulis sp.]